MTYQRRRSTSVSMASAPYPLVYALFALLCSHENGEGPFFANLKAEEAGIDVFRHKHLRHLLNRCQEWTTVDVCALAAFAPRRVPTEGRAAFFANKKRSVRGKCIKLYIFMYRISRRTTYQRRMVNF